MRNRYEFPRFLRENDCKIGLEIGTYKGTYSRYLLDNWEGHLYLIDVWKKLPYEEYTDMSNQNNPKEIIAEVFDNLEGYEDRTTLIRGNSLSTAHLFQDEFFDFIYIDANHKYKYVIQDMKTWYPKLKKGGIFAGHDWIADYNPKLADENGDIHVWMYDTHEPTQMKYVGLFGVNKAVPDFCGEMGVTYEITTDEYFQTWYFRK